jgi:hypothetical protein
MESTGTISWYRVATDKLYIKLLAPLDRVQGRYHECG